MMDSILDERFVLEDLLDVSMLKEVIESYSRCFNVGVELLDYNGGDVISVCPPHGVCRNLEDKYKDKCGDMRSKIARQELADAQVLQIKAFCGMRYSVFPLTHQLETFGRVILGPFRDAETKPSVIAGLMGMDPNDEESIKRIENMAVFDQTRLKLTIRLLAKILDAFLFINAKRLITTRLHLETVFSEREKIFQQVEKQDTATREDKEELDKLKDMF